jgi:excisionase family DNA binding protein
LLEGPATAGATEPEEVVMTTYLTTEELADYLSVPVNTIYQGRVRGIAPRAAKVGRHMRWNINDVDQWLAERSS